MITETKERSDPAEHNLDTCMNELQALVQSVIAEVLDEADAGQISEEPVPRMIEIPFPEGCGLIHGYTSITVPVRDILAWMAAAEPHLAGPLLAIRDDFYGGDDEEDYDPDLEGPGTSLSDCAARAELVVALEKTAVSRIEKRERLLRERANHEATERERMAPFATEDARDFHDRQLASQAHKRLQDEWVQFVRDREKLSTVECHQRQLILLEQTEMVRRQWDAVWATNGAMWDRIAEAARGRNVLPL